MAKASGFGCRLTLAFWLTLGFGVVWSTVSAWFVGIFESAPTEYQQFVVDGDGTPLIRRQRRESDYHVAIEHVDLDGKPRPEAKPDEMLSMTYLHFGANVGFPRQPFWSERVVRVVDPGPGPEGSATLWYLVRHEPDIAYFVGYDGPTRRRIGYLGTEGPSETLPPRERMFPVDPNARSLSSCATNNALPQFGGYRERRRPNDVQPWHVFVWGPRALRFVDLRTGMVETLIADAPISAASLLQMRMASKEEPAFATQLLVLAGDAIVRFDGTRKQVGSVPIPPEVRGKSTQVGVLPDGGLALVTTETEAAVTHDVNRIGDYRYTLYVISPEGRLRAPTSTTLQHRGANVTGASLGAIVASPGVLAVLLPLVVRSEAGVAIADIPTAVATQFGLALPTALAIAAFLAWRTNRRERAFAASPAGRRFWTAAVLAFGLPMWVGYRFSRRWPATEPCAACAAPTPLDRPQCSHCAAEFATPARLGTEVFA